MNYKSLIIGSFLLLLGQSLSWFQTNGQFISEGIKNNPILTSLLGGIPIGLSYIYGTAYVVEAFNGALWSSRIIGFATGILIFSFLTYMFMKEGINLKTGVILSLATVIIILQVFWKYE